MRHRVTLFATAFGATILSGWTTAQSMAPATLVRAIGHVASAGIPAVPVQPKPFSIPAQPIVPASSDGYLPSSWNVTPKGEFALTLPLAVPPGRAGMAPSLSLDYASGTGNGIAGVGWSLTGFSAITRGGRVWARDGATDGVDFTVRDRFYLDGQELVGVTATPYGGNGAEYRTEPDTFVRVHSTSALALDPKGPEQFTVELGDGRVRTYEAHEAQQVVFDDDNKVFAHGPVRAEWRIASEADASGNTIIYEYEDTAGPGGANAENYWIESAPSKIYYTANLTGGQPTHGLQDLPQRYVAFEYESRPDTSNDWLSGVQRRHTRRLKAIRMHAPNPTATAEVWRYTFDYALAGSGRSLLGAVQRCEAVGGCLWAKQFTYSPSTNTVAFQAQPVVPAPIPAASYDLTWPSATEGEVPAMQLLDLNGDGASDLLFGAGAGMIWEQIHYGPPYDHWLPTGKFLGGSHSLWLSKRDAGGHLVPLGEGLSVARDEEPLATANYGHVRLDEATAVDLDGDGKDELVAAVDNLGAIEVNVDPNLPPLYRCSFAELRWTAAGFVHAAATPCTLLGDTEGDYRFYLPDELPMFADFNGDGLPDRASEYNAGGWIGSNNPNDIVQFEYSPAWQVAFNDRTKPGTFGSPGQFDKWRASPGVVTDLDADGRAELTSEAEKISLTFDDEWQWAKAAPDSVHQPSAPVGGSFDGYREFGDFNGDGTEDELLLTRAEPLRPDLLTGRVFWNTGRGFYADSHVRLFQVDAHPDWAKQQVVTRFADPGIHLTDVNNDGRMDVVIFNNDAAAANQPQPRVQVHLSNGDGMFFEIDLPVQAGTRDDVKYRVDNDLRPINYYPDRLENDVKKTILGAFGQYIPGASILLQAIPFEEYHVPGGDEKTPGMAAGWNLAALADTNGDGLIDIVRHVGGNDASAGFEVLQQTPAWGDELVDVKDEATAWPALSVQYSSEWSDRPEVNDTYQCTYPLSCPKSGLRAVRSVTSRMGLTDLAPNEDPLARGHTWEYAYRDPVANRQGLGFFGFSEMRVWDTAPDQPVETITTFDLRTPDATGTHYPGIGVPASVTIAQPILQPGQGKVASAPARLTQTTYGYEFRALNGGATHAVLPQSVHTSQWEEPVAIAWSGQGPDRLHISGYAAPANPTIHVDTQMTCDDYGNVTDRVSQTAKGLKTDVHTPRINDTANWHIGLVAEHSVMTLESAKNAVPVWQTTDYAYNAKAQLETIAVEPNAADPSLQATTGLTYDDYGLVTGITTVVANELPRARYADYANAWPGAPDEHLYASTLWTLHENPSCSVDCRPAAWMLTHPAYGLPAAAMDINGVETMRTWDSHGRSVHEARNGELPVDVTYGGRPDAFGGMNGIQATATSGLQQVLKTFDARGAPLRASFVGFDGQWINTFATYDGLGRRTAVSRPSTGVPAAWTTVDYDSLGRAVSTNFPDGSRATSAFSLLEIERTDPAGHHGHRSYDVDGRLVASGNELQTPGCGWCLPTEVNTTYRYGATAVGAVASVTDDQGHVTTTQYDRLGRAVKQDDPSTGMTEVTYNAFGEAKQTVHVANGDVETETYDDLGRIVTTMTPDGLTTFTWDVAQNGVGRLAASTSPDQIKTAYRYDSLGRTIGIDQTDETNATLSLDFALDAQNGRLVRLDYPQAPGQAFRLRVAYGYNGYGYLTTVSDATSAQSNTIWQEITVRNADLALVDAVRGLDGDSIGGGAIADHRDYDPLTGRLWTIRATHDAANRLTVSYNYDADGLVEQRTTTDEDVQIDETFEHDALHRLIRATRNGMPLQNGLPFSSNLEETYDSVGNRIDTLRNGQIVEHRSYGSNGQQPYALTERDIFDPSNPNQPAVQAYQYDALGRLMQDPHRILAWTAFDLPLSIIEDGKTFAFRYDANRVRVRKSGPDETVTSFAGLYEQHLSATGRRHVFHIVGSDEAVAEVTYTESAQPKQAGTTQVRYPLTDALGTLAAVADAGGAVTEHDYYDAWGKRTLADGTPLDNPTLFQSLMDSGFTGHAHDDDLALVNMQGRIYDPTLGRFLSADPIVGNPGFSQSWNAYSYVLNGPLDFTDPSGFDPCPAGYSCETGPGNEISNTIQTPIGNETFGYDIVDLHASAAGSLSRGMAWMRSSIDLAKLQHENDMRTGRALPDGTKIRTADGTPILPRRINAQNGNRLEDNWGYPIRGHVIGPTASKKSPVPANTDGILTRRAADFAVRLFCGTKCASAGAPTSAREAAASPKQLSNARIARNALSQALAGRALVKFLAKVGVIIDEGVDGIVNRILPDGMGMDDDEKKVMQMLAERRAERMRLIQEAFERYTQAERRHDAAIRLLEKRLAQKAAAADEVDAIDASTVGADLIRSVYADAVREYANAQKEVERTNRSAQFALDWLKALQEDDEHWQ